MQEGGSGGLTAAKIKNGANETMKQTEKMKKN